MVVCLFHSSKFHHYYWTESFVWNPSSQFQMRIIYQMTFFTTSYKSNNVFLVRAFRIFLWPSNIFFCYLLKVNSLFDKYTSPDAFIWNVHWNFFCHPILGIKWKWNEQRHRKQKKDTLKLGAIKWSKKNECLSK